jgi:hypothetical protein
MPITQINTNNIGEIFITTWSASPFATHVRIGEEMRSKSISYNNKKEEKYFMESYLSLKGIYFQSKYPKIKRYNNKGYFLKAYEPCDFEYLSLEIIFSDEPGNRHRETIIFKKMNN